MLGLSGSPFLFHVESLDSGYVTAYGPGLSHGVVYENAVFTINTKNAGAGQSMFYLVFVGTDLDFVAKRGGAYGTEQWRCFGS